MKIVWTSPGKKKKRTFPIRMTALVTRVVLSQWSAGLELSVDAKTEASLLKKLRALRLRKIAVSIDGVIE